MVSTACISTTAATCRTSAGPNVGEDAFTIKSSGTVNVSGVTGVNSEDKFAQVNAASTLNVSNCIVDNAGKFLRQNGGTTFKITVNVDRCQHLEHG